MNLFKQIWNRNYKKGTPAEKLADDIGPFRGIVKVREYDQATGKIIDCHEQKNMLVNLSKTNIIRLIAQGQSPWVGAIDPSKLAISRMRFGNATSGYTPSVDDYYNGSEAISSGQRASKFTPSGGGTNAAVINSEGNYVASLQDFIETSELGIHGPSNGTFIATFIKSINGADRVVEELTFSNSPYTRAINGNPVVSIKTFLVDGKCYPIVNQGSSIVPTVETTTTPAASSNNCRLFYDYMTPRGWKFMFSLCVDAKNNIASGTGAYNRIVYTYNTGDNNIIQHVVPQLGINKGNSVAPGLRFGGQDFYGVQNIEYIDCPTEFIDDFSATFSINMSGQFGNNGQPSGIETVYNQAWLCNGNDDVFSAIALTAGSTGFRKSSDNAYYISWSILAPTN